MSIGPTQGRGRELHSAEDTLFVLQKTLLETRFWQNSHFGVHGSESTVLGLALKNQGEGTSASRAAIFSPSLALSSWIQGKLRQLSSDRWFFFFQLLVRDFGFGFGF